MEKKFKVITMCGSTKFKDDYIEVTKWLTLQGIIVISVGLFGQTDGDKLTPEEKMMLDDLHKGKIDLCDEIFVINPGNYIGTSTTSEIKYAKEHGKVVRYMTDELIEINKWKDAYYGRTVIHNWNLATVINL